LLVWRQIDELRFSIVCLQTDNAAVCI